MLDVTDRLVVVIGGGAVAARKVTGLLAAGAQRVRVVAPAFAAELPHVPAVQRVAETFAPRHLDGAGLVFAATDSTEVNASVVGEAKGRGLLVSRVDADGDDDASAAGDFTTPAVHHGGGGLVVAVSAGGSPALAVRVRDEIAARLDPRWALLAVATQVLRPLVLASGLDATRRRDILRQLTSDAALEVVAREGVDGLRRWVGGKYPELRDA
jgi:siroheme synthase-like protein